MYKAKDLRDQSIEELEVSYDEACKSIFDLVNEAKKTKMRENSSEIRKIRKGIARILTIITEKKAK